MTALPEWDVVTDAKLVAAATAGDRGAFAEIYSRYADRLHDFCIGMVRNRDTAADCVQDVFCIAATRLSQLNDPDKLGPWLYSIARHQTLRSIRQAGRETVLDDVPDAVSAEPPPDVMAARTELADLIAQATGGLSDRDRTVLDLTYRHGLDGPQLAEALGVSYHSAKKLTQRLRETIERSLGALLVSRQAVNNPNRCPELGALLDGWGGQFTVLMRKRIARHIDFCPTCEHERDRLVNPVALLGAAPVCIPAPDWLRARTLDQIHLTANATPAASSTAKPPETTAATTENNAAVGRGHHRGAHADLFLPRRLLVAAIVVAIVVAALVLTLAWLYERHPATGPADVTNTVPSLSSAPAFAPRTAQPPPASPPPAIGSVSPVTTTASAAPTQPLPPSAVPPITTTIPAVTSQHAPPFAPPGGTSVAPPRRPTVTRPPTSVKPPTTQPPTSPVEPTKPVIVGPTVVTVAPSKIPGPTVVTVAPSKIPAPTTTQPILQ
jgi:RNA polymerase sigma factor (sigma-70 family)